MARTLALLSLLALVQPAPSMAQAAAAVPPGLEARIGAAVARSWGVDSAGLVLSWGRGSLAGLPEASPFRLLGGGEGGWFALLVEPAGAAPVAMRLRAGLPTLRRVAARAVASGQSLEAADIREETVVRWGPPGPPEPAVEPGWVARRRMAPGALLDAAHVAPAPAVSAGQPVRVHWREGGVSVALDGVALHDAALGAPVRVRTGRSRGVVRASVIAPGEARMN